jgi:hypothetical protein
MGKKNPFSQVFSTTGSTLINPLRKNRNFLNGSGTIGYVVEKARKSAENDQFCLPK